MSYFYTKDGAPFIPEKINPELAKLAMSIVKTCRLSFKCQMKTTSLTNAIKGGKKDVMADIMQKCMEKNRSLYNSDMSLTGVEIKEVDDSFFADKDEEFYKNQLAILVDFAYINTVVEARMMPLMSAACEKTLNKKINQLLFFTNQTEILEDTSEDEEETTEE